MSLEASISYSAGESSRKEGLSFTEKKLSAREASFHYAFLMNVVCHGKNFSGGSVFLWPLSLYRNQLEWEHDLSGWTVRILRC